MFCFLLGHNMVKDITVVETNYTDYALVLKHKVFNREYTQVALYGKTHTLKFAYTLHLNMRVSESQYMCVFVWLNFFAGRSQNVRPSVIQKFKAFAAAQGFSRDSVLTPPPAGKVGRTHICILYRCIHRDNRKSSMILKFPYFSLFSGQQKIAHRQDLDVR